MRPVTVQDIQQIAVTCVTQFFNNKVPLSEGLAKQASVLELNTDQLQRAVEATNTLAYLKSLELSPDRTGEFPLADYNQILKMAFVPENTTGSVEPQLDLFSQIFANGGSGSWKIDKQASESEETIGGMDKFTHAAIQNWDEDSALRLLMKEASVNRQKLETLELHSPVVVSELTKLASDLSKDAQAVEKLSAITATPAEFTKLAFLVFGEGHDKKRVDYAEGMFPKSEMAKAAALMEKLAEARKVAEEIKAREDMIEKIAEGLEKSAMWPMFASMAQGAASVIRRNLGKSGAGTKLLNGAEKVRNFAQNPARGTGELMGKVTRGAVVGGTKFAVKPIVGAAKGLVSGAGKAVNNGLASTTTGKNLGMTKKPQSAKLTAGLTAGMAVADSTVWSPSANETLGTSGKVWDSLN